MTSQRIGLFRDQLERQLAGDPCAAGNVRSLDIGPEDGLCFLLWNEWKSAFSYEPGRTEALAPILGLARKIEDQSGTDAIWLYTQPEWSALQVLSSPAECVGFRDCRRCGRTHTRMGLNAFLDQTDWVCARCGGVCFMSVHDDSLPPPCSCGGSYTAPSVGCPFCGKKIAGPTRYISSFEYFAKHAYIRLDEDDGTPGGPRVEIGTERVLDRSVVRPRWKFW